MNAKEVTTWGDFTGSTLDLMQSLMDKWGRHPFFVQFSREVANLGRAENPEGEAWAVWAWIRANVTYRADPVGTQWIQDPFETAVKSRAGNCANMATLAGAMLQALGHPCKATAVWWDDREDWTHAVCFDAKLGRIVDPVSPTFDWPPNGRKVRKLKPGAVQQFFEEGKGLGFSIGGWHPFRVNTYLPTLKKLDPLAHTALGKAVWKPVEKINQSVNKDFAKGKVWSQKHRKELQIAAAIAATVLTAGIASGAIGAAEVAGEAAAEGAAGAAVASEGVVTSAALAPEAMTALAPSVIPEAAGLVPGIAPTVAASGGGIGWSSILSGAGTAAKDAAAIAALSKALTGKQPGSAGVDVQSYYTGGGSGGGYTGGGSIFSSLPTAGEVQQTVNNLPPWALPVGIGLLLFLVIRR